MDAKRLTSNTILAGLPADVRARIEPHLDLVNLGPGAILHEPNAPLSYAYFPLDAVVSMLGVLRDGASVEVAVVGKEGVLGCALFMGGNKVHTRAVVEFPGEALRLRRSILASEFQRGNAFQDRLLRYVLWLLTQTMQIASCVSHHEVEQQFCRWILTRLDRLGRDELDATQHAIAGALGVRRQSVAAAAAQLQDQDLIRFQRGKVKVLDRKGLEGRVCECYETMRKDYERLLGAPS